MTGKRRSGGVSAEEKTMMLLEFARLPVAETGEWLRKKGLQSEHLKLWESELTTKNDTRELKEEIRILQTKNIRIEKDLLKKDKALAELSAIVILQKKMADLFPREEET
jgi:hypothetical protein